MDSLRLIRPDDWHLHLRDGAAMASVVAHTAAQFGRAIVMPNLKPPVVNTEQALAYRQRILEALPVDSRFQPLMTLYLTDNTPASEIKKARETGFIHAIKLYPAGATTNSDHGVTDIGLTYDTLHTMAEAGMPLLVHGEVTGNEVDVFDREAVFIEKILAPLIEKIPSLRIVMEHITTADAADFVLQAGDNIAATITPQHLLMNRNAIFQGGIRPHHYCLPILKREKHRQRLLEVATSGSNKFFLGTDSAPHAQGDKESACGCAGIYSAHAAIELYAEAFEQAGALDKLEGFASFHGADFYGLPRNTETISLQRQEWTVADHYPMGEKRVIPLRAGDKLDWKLV